LGRKALLACDLCDDLPKNHELVDELADVEADLHAGDGMLSGDLRPRRLAVSDEVDAVVVPAEQLYERDQVIRQAVAQSRQLDARIPADVSLDALEPTALDLATAAIDHLAETF
jgi:hypothetical protein